jgi:hypothetical protein
MLREVKMKILTYLFVILFASTVFNGPVNAQWDFNPSLVSDVMRPVIMNPCPNGDCGQGETSDQNRGSSAQEKIAVTTSYRPSKALTKKHLAQFVAKSRASDPAMAEKMEQLFASQDVIKYIGEGISPFGLRTDDVADAYAVYWMTAWQAANRDVSDFTYEQSQAVKQQAANALLATSAFVQTTDAIKQEMAEAYLVQAALIQAAVDNGKTDNALAAGLAKAVRQGAKASGLELDKMTLTEDGFVPKKGRRGADASGAVGDEEVKQASAAGSDNTLQYGLMAALGLGAAFMIGKGMKRG